MLAKEQSGVSNIMSKSEFGSLATIKIVSTPVRTRAKTSIGVNQGNDAPKKISVDDSSHAVNCNFIKETSKRHLK